VAENPVVVSEADVDRNRSQKQQFSENQIKIIL
jgi:hypothetical protein